MMLPDRHFNPQVPCGTRPDWHRSAPRARYFNPQVPCGTRRSLSSCVSTQEIFQSTGPLRDPTIGTTVIVSAPTLFQSTGPLRDPTVERTERRTVTVISIHRSLAGPDPVRPSSFSAPQHFNPQVPCGTRRKVLTGLTNRRKISIHRSLAGPDRECYQVSTRSR